MMSGTAVACPHCGTRQVDRDPLPEGERPAAGPLSKAKLTKEEMHALLAVDSTNRKVATETGPGLFSVLLLPHPMTQGLGRALDVVLTVAAFPLMLSGVFLLLIFGRRRSFSVLTRRLRGNVEITAAVFASVLGAVSVYLSALFAPLPAGVDPAIVVVVGVSALILRVVVRQMAER
jgi:hypothetical protein